MHCIQISYTTHPGRFGDEFPSRNRWRKQCNDPVKLSVLHLANNGAGPNATTLDKLSGALTRSGPQKIGWNRFKYLECDGISRSQKLTYTDLVWELWIYYVIPNWNILLTGFIENNIVYLIKQFDSNSCNVVVWKSERWTMKQMMWKTYCKYVGNRSSNYI